MAMRRENVAAALKYLQDKADLRGRAERAVSLDPQEQDLADIAVETGASFIPGVGQALAARDVERARRADDPVGMAMASMGAIPGGRLAGLLKRYDPIMARIDAYHGTADDFDVFDPKMGGRATGAESGRQATWFVDEPKVAKGYAVHAAEVGPYDRKINEAKTFMARYEQTNDPADLNQYYKLVREAGDLEKTAFDRRVANARLMQVEIPDETNFLVVNARGKTPQELSTTEDIDSWLQLQLEKAKRQKKEGVKILNLDDAAGLANAPATHYAVFDPSRVKIKSKEKLIK